MPGFFGGVSVSGVTINFPAMTGVGLRRTEYNDYFFDNPNWFATATVSYPTNTNTSPITFNDLFRTGAFSVQWLGYWYATKSNTYTFSLFSDDASYLWLGPEATINFTTSNAFINNGGLHAGRTISNSIYMYKGTYTALRIQYGNFSGIKEFEFGVATSDFSYTTSIDSFIRYRGSEGLN